MRNMRKTATIASAKDLKSNKVNGVKIRAIWQESICQSLSGILVNMKLTAAGIIRR
jgi:hypothetical protein